jgi:hypothetical protein
MQSLFMIEWLLYYEAGQVEIQINTLYTWNIYAYFIIFQDKRPSTAGDRKQLYAANSTCFSLVESPTEWIRKMEDGPKRKSKHILNLL